MQNANHRTAIAGLLLGSLALFGCDAVRSVGKSAVSSGLVTISDGQLEVRNMLPVALCRIVVVPSTEPGRKRSDILGADRVEPGASAFVRVPHAGQPGEPAPEGTTYAVHAYDCAAPSTDSGGQVAPVVVVSDVNPKSEATVLIR